MYEYKFKVSWLTKCWPVRTVKFVLFEYETHNFYHVNIDGCLKKYFQPAAIKALLSAITRELDKDDRASDIEAEFNNSENWSYQESIVAIQQLHHLLE